jgi:hypothetical protein
VSGYAVEAQRPSGWIRLFSESRAYCQGWIACARETPSPRLALRLVRLSDGKVVLEQTTGCPDASVGQVAGWPSPEQYRAAAARALSAADLVEQRSGRQTGPA